MAGDFEAKIRIYSRREGGRWTPTFNGIRWDFAYAEGQPVGQLYMIWPDFVGMEGPLPVGVSVGGTAVGGALVGTVVGAMGGTVGGTRVGTSAATSVGVDAGADAPDPANEQASNTIKHTPTANRNWKRRVMLASMRKFSHL